MIYQKKFQFLVKEWLVKCFGIEIASDKNERNHRFLEESLELVQACGCTKEEANMMVDYVFNRPLGEKSQEVGGVVITLAALCCVQDINMVKQGEIELERICQREIMDKIRTKQKTKPKSSTLPQNV